MAWAPDPAAQRAAEDAQAEAQAAIMARLDAEADRKLTPFERKLLGLIEDVRDAIKDRPAALAALGASLVPGLDASKIIVERPAGPIADPGRLLDASPDTLGRAIDAAAMTLSALLDLTDLALAHRAAEAALDAALKEAADAELDRHFETTPRTGADAPVGPPEPTAAVGDTSAPGNTAGASALTDPPTYVAMCPCGARFEVYGEMTDEDRDAAADFDDAHLDCDMTSEVLDEAEGGAAGGDAHPPAEHPAD
ncbi:hypothetical protein [Mycolicibacterium mageritense]|uniref:hypothetical protein n=1 Tax=Mycolicibacterium mageritense TaxID=53462 RepID=UPI001E36F8EE|nr:hypothetical protein [Mycolicibacterium mageritense]GJJ21094.1 hypothetical protein MTY414_47670 [Mycolicibacterium mageritense]